MTIDNILKKQIDDLTDFDINNINTNTLIEEIGFDSLDFLSVQVSLQRELNFLLDLGLLAEAVPNTYGELLALITAQYNESVL